MSRTIRLAVGSIYTVSNHQVSYHFTLRDGQYDDAVIVLRSGIKFVHPWSTMACKIRAWVIWKHRLLVHFSTSLSDVYMIIAYKRSQD